MLILDTDILTIVQLRRGGLYEQVVAWIERHGDDVSVSIISFEEQLRGWLSFIAKMKHVSDQLLAYDRLMVLLDDYQSRAVLPFTVESARILTNCDMHIDDMARWI